MTNESKENKDNKSETGKVLDKVLMGVIIGGAIGSVLGASIAPKKGKENRKYLESVAIEGAKKSVSFINKIKSLFKKEDKRDE